MIYKLSPSWVWQDAGRDKRYNMQEPAFIVVYRYITLQKPYEVFSDFCINQRFVEVLAFCTPSTDHPFAFYVQLNATDDLMGAHHLPKPTAILTCT
jgi:hypothetical protein